MDAGTSRLRRRELRREATIAEKLLWWRLRARQLEGAKFRRQHPVGPYIVDFYCAERGLAVELDGGQHFTDEGKAYDERRTEYLAAQGVRVIRFSNGEIFEELEGVVEAIRQTLCPSPASLRSATSPRWRGAR
jgi:very-short-patch-repair endonuclease